MRSPRYQGFANLTPHISHPGHREGPERPREGPGRAHGGHKRAQGLRGALISEETEKMRQVEFLSFGGFGTELVGRGAPTT